jgi:drug/metabolite transporter (DMT)-like permease
VVENEVKHTEHPNYGTGEFFLDHKGKGRAALKKWNQSRIKGIVMVLAGASLWGISGTVAQVLFQREQIVPGWLVTVRLLLSGILLLGLASFRRDRIFEVWSRPRDRFSILIFSLIGLTGVQYTYFASIEAGNATVATLLQYLGPAFITLYLALRFRRWPHGKDWLALALAMAGTFLLVTDGSTEGLTVPPSAVVWGLLNALTAAFYTVYPVELIKRWGSQVTVGWGMVIGGIVLSAVFPPWDPGVKTLSLLAVGLTAFVVLFGTLISFYLYLESLRFISPSEAGILGSAEPLSAALMAVLWLHHTPGLWEIAGGLLIISTVALLSAPEPKRKRLPNWEEKKEAVGEG